MGWNIWEGTYNYRPDDKIPPTSVIKPILEYPHNINPKGHSICGGFIYRPEKNLESALSGKYIFADLIGPLFVGTESPAGSGKFAYVRVSWGCSKSSPIECPNTTGMIYSMAEDNQGELYFLTDSGVYLLSDANSCTANQLFTNSPEKEDTILYVIVPIAVCIFIVTAYCLHSRFSQKSKSNNSNTTETDAKNPQK